MNSHTQKLVPNAARPGRAAGGPARSHASPTWAYAVCILLAGVAFAMFVFFLDRYPPFYVDEPAFNASAARYVSGQGFVYPLHTQAPHADDVWAYHGPFFPRMQVLTFLWLGVSHWACRFPGFLGAHLAVLVLCIYLLRLGLWRSSVALATAWVGDRSTQLVLLGRPDGVSHFLVVLGFVLLLRGLDRRSCRLLSTSCVCVGMAIGFSPAAVFFGPALAAAVFLWLPRQAWIRALGAMAGGALLPAVLFLVCWLPDIPASFEQFTWYAKQSTKGEWVATVPERLMAVWRMPYWAKYWILGLVVSSCVLAVRIMGRGNAPRIERTGTRLNMVPKAALLFTIAAIALFLNSSMHAYYFVFFTIWPVVALASAWETGLFSGRWRVPIVAWTCVLAFAWVLSLTWNLTRFREAWQDYDSLDKRPMELMIGRCFPRGGEMACDPVYFVVIHRVGMRYTPLPFYRSDPGLSLRDRDYCLLSSRYVDMLNSSDPGWRSGRSLVLADMVFRDSYSLQHNYFIYAPGVHTADE